MLWKVYKMNDLGGGIYFLIYTLIKNVDAVQSWTFGQICQTKNDCAPNFIADTDQRDN